MKGILSNKQSVLFAQLKIRVVSNAVNLENNVQHAIKLLVLVLIIQQTLVNVKIRISYLLILNAVFVVKKYLIAQVVRAKALNSLQYVKLVNKASHLINLILHVSVLVVINKLLMDNAKIKNQVVG